MNSSTIKPKFINANLWSSGFPPDLENLLFRENYVSTIDDYFQSGVNIVFLDGEEDCGKTTLCAIYAKRNANKVISVFFNPYNDLDYSMGYFCTDVVMQLQYLLGEENPKIDGFVGIETYQNYMFQIQRKLRQSKEKIYFIVDGLEEKLKEKNSHFVADLISLLPIAYPNIFLIISGNEEHFNSSYLKGKDLNSKSIHISGLSDLEIAEYLKDTSYDALRFKEVFKITKGFPGRLKVLKRILQAGTFDIEEIMANKSYKGWIQMDCESIDTAIPEIMQILSLIALTESAFSMKQIASILDIPEEQTNKFINQISIVENSIDKVTFISSSHKRYYTTLLKGNKKPIQDRLIKFYASDENVDSLIALPRIYFERNDFYNVIDAMREDYAKKLMESTESISEVLKGLALGIVASEKLKQFPSMYRFSLECSLINQLDSFVAGKSEVKALIAIGDFKGAIAIAESSILKVDRLRLLALIARRQKESMNQVDEDVEILIGQLYLETEFSGAGDKIYDVVADLIYALPNFAIQMIEKSSIETTDRNINDWILAKLSIAAIDSSIKGKEDVDTSEKVKAINTLAGKDAKKINKAISLLVGRYNGKRVIDEVRKMSETKERLRLLRLWLTNFRGTDKSLGDVIVLGLDEVVSGSIETELTIDILKELSDQLPFVTDKLQKDNLIYRFKKIENSTPNLGLSRNRVVYELNLFHAEYTLDRVNSVQAINDLILLIGNIGDDVVRLEAYTEIYVKIKHLGFKKIQEKIDFIYAQIRLLAQRVFESTASHFEVANYSIKTLAKYNPVLAIKLVDNVNMQWRRDRLRQVITESYLSNNIRNISFDKLREIENSFEDKSLSEALCLNILDRFSEASSLPAEVVRNLIPYFTKLHSIKPVYPRLYGLVQVYIILCKNTFWLNRLGQEYKNRIVNTYKGIESDWDKIDIGYSASADLARADRKFASEIFDLTQDTKNQNWISSHIVSETYLLCVKLTIKSFSGLIKKQSYSKDDEKQIEKLILRIASQKRRLDLWTEFSFIAYLHDDITLAKRIFDNHVVALLDGVIANGSLLEECIPSFTLSFLFNQSFATSRLNGLNESVSQGVYYEICQFYITRHNPFNVYDEKISELEADFLSISNAIFVLEKIDRDQYVYFHLSQICQAIGTNRLLTKQQRVQLLNSMQEIINKKLPDPKNIKHQGYRILSEAKMALANKDINVNDLWSKLKVDTDAIPNLSDRAFVKCILLKHFPFDRSRQLDRCKGNLFDEVILDFSMINSDYEFIRRVIDVSDNVYEKSRWKVVLIDALVKSDSLPDTAQQYKLQREILETTYKLDDVFAKDMLQQVANRGVTLKYTKSLQKYLEMLQVATKIKKSVALTERDRQNSRVVVAAVMQALRALNSSRIQPRKIHEVSTFLHDSARLPLLESFPIYDFYLTNCYEMYSTKSLSGSVADLHKENFDRAFKCASLVPLLSVRKMDSQSKLRNTFAKDDFSSNAAIHPNSREEAMMFIKEWMDTEVANYIVFADPYFGARDLELVKLAPRGNSALRIYVLGSREGVDSEIESKMAEYWKQISDEPVPFTHVTYAWIPDLNNDTPFHDRWILTANSGLRVGTSFNSLGYGKESEISVMPPNEAMKIMDNSLREYLEMEKDTINGMKIKYRKFRL